MAKKSKREQSVAAMKKKTGVYQSPYKKFSPKKYEKTKSKIYKSGMMGNKPIDLSSPKTKRGIITSVD